MSLTLFSTVFEVGFHPREIPTVPVRSPSAPGPSPSAPPAPESDPVDIVDTGASSDSGNGFFEQSPEKFGLPNARTRYAIDLDSNEVVIKVIDPDTQDEIRQIPTEEHRELARRIQQYQQIAFDR